MERLPLVLAVDDPQLASKVRTRDANVTTSPSHAPES